MSYCVEITKKQAEQMPTRQLLKILYKHYWGPECENCQYQCYMYLNRAILKEVLKNRSHIPNKEESKALRKIRIKEGV